MLDTKDTRLEAEARMATWRTIIGFLERSPEWFDAVLTGAYLADPPETFNADRAKYAGISAIADDYLQFGHFSHCATCYQTIALYPSHRLNYPAMTPHRCGGLAAFREWERTNKAPEAAATPAPERTRRPSGWERLGAHR